jgi:hypothetical protein
LGSCWTAMTTGWGDLDRSSPVEATSWSFGQYGISAIAHASPPQHHLDYAPGVVCYPNQMHVRVQDREPGHGPAVACAKSDAAGEQGSNCLRARAVAAPSHPWHDSADSSTRAPWCGLGKSRRRQEVASVASSHRLWPPYTASRTDPSAGAARVRPSDWKHPSDRSPAERAKNIRCGRGSSRALLPCSPGWLTPTSPTSARMQMTFNPT